MSVRGKAGGLELDFKQSPRGKEGSTQVAVGGKVMDVKWKRDGAGIWIELPHGVFGFDIVGLASDEGGATYNLLRRGAQGEWAGVRFSRSGDGALQGAAASGAKKGVRVRSQMPGKIISVSVQAGSAVQKDQPLFVMEAMKMENVIRAPQAGKVAKVSVTAGQTIESGAELCTIEAGEAG